MRINSRFFSTLMKEVITPIKQFSANDKLKNIYVHIVLYIKNCLKIKTSTQNSNKSY